MTRTMSVAMLLVAGLAASASAGRQERFEDVVRNLRNPDPKVRISAVRLLREARHQEAIVPLAPLVNDQVDAIQLETLAAELSFFLVQDIPVRRRIGFVEVRSRGAALTAFELGPLGVWPRPAPPELIAELLKAVDDQNARVRLEAIYAVGTIARSPLPPDAEQPLLKALDHYDPAIRAGAARAVGRLAIKGAFDSLMKAVNDSNAEVRYYAMQALGSLRDDRAVNALTEQLKYYGKGDGAVAALDGLARIGHQSSIPLFTARLSDRDPAVRRVAAEGLGRAMHKPATSDLEVGAGNDPSDMVRAAMQYSLHKLGRNYISRLIEFLDDPRTVLQVQEYFIEFGPPVEKELLPNLQDSNSAIRIAVADVLGEIGGDASLTALQSMKDAGKDVGAAASRAVERIKMRRAL